MSDAAGAPGPDIILIGRRRHTCPGVPTMVAAFIFIFLFGTYVTLHREHRRSSLILFMVSMILVTLLFLHHATDRLDLSF
jgi:hypothetical protein